MTRAFILNKDLEKSYIDDTPNMCTVKHEVITFSGGEPHVKITNPDRYSDTKGVVFVTKLRTPKDLIELACAVDAFDQLGTGADVHLQIGYLPGGRQDRVCVPGEAFTAKVYANLINNLAEWSSISFIDSHSDVMPALLDHCIDHNVYNFVDEAIVELDLEDFTLVSPDAGANKKVLGLAQHITNSNFENVKKVEVVRADKLRDVSTGQILETIVYSDSLKGKDCVIVDDICDGGRTFIELAKVLRDDNGDSITVIGLNSNFYTYK